MILPVAIATLAALSDHRNRTIPNKLSAAMACVALAVQAMRVWVPEAIARMPLTRAVVAGLAPAGACVACAAACLVTLAGVELVRRAATGVAGMGMGDVKYVSAWAVLLGPAVLPAAVVAMAAGGMAALARGERDFALGPWLSACCLAALLGIAIAGAVG